ncbi:hypothetical protein AMTR_s00020p00117980 [Amborella trichopoda]|uniref:Uncharacterized protein n=1 Tax=Amborella trichopoda TaxID=13333 RepID=W1PWU8_AMBTC|nr:hypothetical protein AMTR_s00020p00117980 [Amborella trichopoda]
MKVVHSLIRRSSLEELIQLPDLLERTAANLTAFGMPKAFKLNKIMGELTQESDLAYREGFHLTLEAHSLKVVEAAALGGISLRDNEVGMIVLIRHIAETETLLSRVYKD